MGVILAKFRKEKSTQEVLEALQEKIDTLETFTVNTQEQKKRIVGNFLAVSIGVYVIAFVVFYFVYFPTTWKERFVYFIPLLLFPLIIILLRYLFTWYFQRKLNKNSTKLTALRAEKKKILEQVMDKETYKVAVNLLARFADKPSKTPTLALTSATPSKLNQSLINRSLPATNLIQKSKQLTVTSTSTPKQTSNLLSPTLPRSPAARIGVSTPTNALMTYNRDINQQLRRRTPFPIVNQQEKGVFDRIVDVIIGDGPQDRFAMICKECYAHNGMALREDFEYTTFRCAFCNALNPARKSRPVAPRLSAMPNSAATRSGSDTSDSDDHKDDSDDEPMKNINTTQYLTPTNNNNTAVTSENNENAASAITHASSDTDNETSEAKQQPQSCELNAGSIEAHSSSFDKLLQKLEKSDSAIDETSISPK